MTALKLLASALALAAAAALALGCAPRPSRGLPYHEAEGPVAHHDLTVDLDPYHNALRVTDRLSLDRSSGAAEPLRFGLSSAATLRWVTVDGKEAEVAQAGQAPGWPDGVTVWEVVVPRRGAAVEISADVPMSRTDGLPGAVSSAGAFLPASAWWHPGRPGERCTFRYTVIAPREWVVAGPGDQIRRAVEGERQALSWESDLPLTGLDLAVAPFHLFTMDGPTPARAWLLKKDEAQAERWLTAAERQLAHLRYFLGPFPAGALNLVEVPDPVLAEAPWRMATGAALSTRRMTESVRTDRIIGAAIFEAMTADAPAPTDEGDWRPAAAAWLESEAPTGLALPPDASEIREAWLRDFSQGPQSAAERPLAEPGPPTPARVGRGAMLLHMLSLTLSQDVVAHGLRALARDGARGRTRWSDLREAMETAAGVDLGPFFEPWLSRQGAPRLTLTAAEAVDLDLPGTGRIPGVRVTVGREGFAAPAIVPVVIEMERGRVTQRLPVSDAITTVDIPLVALTERELAALGRRRLPSPTWEIRVQGPNAGDGLGSPRIARLDPDFDVLRELWPEELLPRIGDVLEDPDVAVLAGSGRNLVEDATLVAALLGRRTVEPARVDAGPPTSVIAVARWSAVSGGAAQVGPLNLPLPRDLVIQKDIVWYRQVPYSTSRATAVLAVPHPLDPARTVLLFLSPGEKALGGAMPWLGTALQSGFIVFVGERPMARGRYEPGANPMMRRLDDAGLLRLDEPAAW